MNKKKIYSALAVVTIIAGVFGVGVLVFRARPGNIFFSEQENEEALNENFQNSVSSAAGGKSESDDKTKTNDKSEIIDIFNTGAIVGDDDNAVNVEKVEVLTLPEAIVIEDGNPGAFYANEDFSDVIPVDISSFAENDLPARYDSRNDKGVNYVSEIEDQGYTSLCWAYSALGAVECDILKHHPEIANTEINLSEKHLAYYNMHSAKGSVNGYMDDDYREFVNADNEKNAWVFDYDTNYIATGGVSDFCISLLTAWKGPVTEKDSDAFNGIVGERYVFENNAVVPSDAYECDYHVQNVNQIRAGLSNNMMIKQMIMEHGGVSVGIYTDNKFWKGRNLSLYSYFGKKTVPTANHEVVIIGWDDEYSSDNFSRKPPGDGAWICKNSWGKKAGYDGYMYLSYYDQNIEKNCVTAYSSVLKSEKDFYDNNYQAAGFITYMTSTTEDSDNYVIAFSDSLNPYGMLYEVQSDEKLDAVGIMGLETYQQYFIEAYVNPILTDGNISLDDITEPDVSMKASSISGGFHTFEFGKKLRLYSGDKVFLLIKPVTRGKLVFEKDVDNISEPNYDEWNNLTGNIHNHYRSSGCSYYISSDGKKMEKQTDKDFFVKMYTKNR